jgi:cysteine-rich repeat protein
VLRALVADGIDTYVIGFGSGDELDRAELDRYAGWGNTKSALVIDPQQSGAVALADALAGVVTGLGLSSCCVLNHCATEPEPKDPGAVCGDGRVEGDEKCDDGADNATYGHCGGRCTGPHLYCGDARLDGPEQCDDGNMRAGDGCDARCLIEVEPASNGTSMDAGTRRADAGDAHVSRPSTIRPLGTPLDASVASTAPRGQAPREPDEPSGPADQDVASSRSRDGGCAVVGEQGARGACTWLLLGLSAAWWRRKKTLLAHRPRVSTRGLDGE